MIPLLPLICLFYSIAVLSFFVFFFQAEDGIRDHCVTGVQTCALPILPQRKLVNIKSGGPAAKSTGQYKKRGAAATRNGQYKMQERCRNKNWAEKKRGAAATGNGQYKKRGQIGRASCRERV